MGPLFSVIIPVYNVEKYLEECVNKIINQPFRDLEIILIDDGSPDKCPEICDSLASKDNRIKVIHKENGGLISARISGAQYASGKYVCCVDSDDLISDDCFVHFAKAIDQESPDIVVGNYMIGDRNGYRRFRHPFESGVYDNDRIAELLFDHLIMNKMGRSIHASLWAKAIRREIYVPIQTSISTSIVMGEDRAVLVPCLLHSSKIVFIDDYVYYYRFNPDSITKGHRPLSWDSLAELTKHFHTVISQNERDLTPQFSRLITQQLFLTASSQFFRNDNYRTIRDEILEKMENEMYRTCVHNCRFSFYTKWKLCEIALQLRWIKGMLIYSRIRSLKSAIHGARVKAVKGNEQHAEV